MKKFLSILLCVSLIFTAVSCGDKTPEESSQESTSEVLEEWQKLTYKSIIDRNEIELNAGESKILVVNAEIKNANYMVVDGVSPQPTIGEITFTDKSGTDYTEDFFLEQNFNGSFRQVLDYYRKHDGDKKVKSIAFKNVGKKSAKLVINQVKVAVRDIEDVLYNNPQVYLTSQALKLGIDMLSGGAIHYLEYTRLPVHQVKDSLGRTLVGVNFGDKDGVELEYDQGVNLLNRYDRGRLVQQSYYGTQYPPYEPSQYIGTVWPYNPVQGGDYLGSSSQIIDYDITEERIYVKCRALDWAKGDSTGYYSITPSYMENVYTVDGELVKVENRFVDFSGYDHIIRDQELPAFYGIISLGTLVTYRGTEPFTSQPLSYYDNLGSWMNQGSRANWFDLTENWLAWINEDDFGVGIYTPNAQTTLSGRIGTNSELIEGRVEISNATTYSTLIKTMRLTTYRPFSYNYYISVGRVTSMRKTFNKLAKTEVNEQLKEY